MNTANMPKRAGEDASYAAFVKRDDRVAGIRYLGKDDEANQISRYHKEDIDADEAAGHPELAHVKGEDTQHRYRSENRLCLVYISTASEAGVPHRRP